jgi:hypothetical protein
MKIEGEKTICFLIYILLLEVFVSVVNGPKMPYILISSCSVILTYLEK